MRHFLCTEFHDPDVGRLDPFLWSSMTSVRERHGPQIVPFMNDDSTF